MIIVQVKKVTTNSLDSEICGKEKDSLGVFLTLYLSFILIVLCLF